MCEPSGPPLMAVAFPEPESVRMASRENIVFP